MLDPMFEALVKPLMPTPHDVKRKTISVYREHVPEHYVGEPSITIHCKDSERATIESDIMCVLIDAEKHHRQFTDTVIKDCRQ